MAQSFRCDFGTTAAGERVELLTLNHGDLSCRIITFGATLHTLCVPDRDGKNVDVVLGYDTLEEYQTHDAYVGAVVGRYANRIAKGRFTLHDQTYVLAVNNGPNHLHGGIVGFSHRVWKVDELTENQAVLSLDSPDGEEGYPGHLCVKVTYTLEKNGLTIRYQARSDKDTPCNLTNHAYFNLSGHSGSAVTGQDLQIFGDRYTPADQGLIPLGEPVPVEGTPMDLRQMRNIGEGMSQDFKQLTQAQGYDHNWVLHGEIGTLHPAARAFSPESGITMEVDTTLPGLQLFVSRFPAPGLKGKGSTPYISRQGFCLETQFWPDSPNHPNYPQAILKAGEVWKHSTVFRFSK